MAKIAGHHRELIDAVRGLGVNPDMVSKLIIEISPGEPVRVHVQGFADKSVINVIKAADGEIEVVREPLETEVTP